MRKKVFSAILAGMICLSGGNAVWAESTNDVAESKEEDEAYYFRKTVWGMSPEEVKNSEDNELLEESEDGISYNGEAAGKDVMIYYSFEDGELIGGLYSFTDEHTNKNLYYDDYLELVDIYKEKYGEPDHEVENWSDDLYKNRPEEIGFAISAGHVCFITYWEAGTTRVSVVLNGDNYEVSLNALYQDTEHKKKVNTDGI